MSATFEVDSDTAVTPSGDGFMATVTDRWNTFLGPNGGYVLGIGLRALAATSPLADPLAVSGHFLRPPVVGEAAIEVEQVRAGRRHATSAARVQQNGKEIVRIVATFADLSEQHGRTTLLAGPPALPAPDDCLDPMAHLDLPTVTIAKRVHYRVPELPGFAKGQPSGNPSTEFWMRFADGKPADALTLPLLVDAAPPVILELGEFASSTVELTVHVRARPAPGWLACRISTRFVVGGYHEEDVEIWDETGMLVAQSRQLALLASS